MRTTKEFWWHACAVGIATAIGVRAGDWLVASPPPYFPGTHIRIASVFVVVVIGALSGVIAWKTQKRGERSWRS